MIYIIENPVNVFKLVLFQAVNSSRGEAFGFGSWGSRVSGSNSALGIFELIFYLISRISFPALCLSHVLKAIQNIRFFFLKKKLPPFCP